VLNPDAYEFFAKYVFLQEKKFLKSFAMTQNIKTFLQACKEDWSF